MRIVFQENIRMKYHALFVVFCWKNNNNKKQQQQNGVVICWKLKVALYRWSLYETSPEDHHLGSWCLQLIIWKTFFAMYSSQ